MTRDEAIALLDQHATGAGASKHSLIPYSEFVISAVIEAASGVNLQRDVAADLQRRLDDRARQLTNVRNALLSCSRQREDLRLQYDNILREKKHLHDQDRAQQQRIDAIASNVVRLTRQRDEATQEVTNLKRELEEANASLTRVIVERDKLLAAMAVGARALAKIADLPTELRLTDVTKPVRTRGGREARVVCADARLPGGENILALIKHESGTETAYYFYSDGRYGKDQDSDWDLVNVPSKPKRGEVWINLYSEEIECTGIHTSRADADRDACEDRIARIRIPFTYRDGQFDE